MDGEGMGGIVSLGAFLIPIVGSIALFSFLAVASWSDAAYYKADALKKISEGSGEAAKSALEYLREEDRISARRRVEGLKLAGLITSAVGLGVMVFLHAVAHDSDRGVYLAGLIPLLIGVALGVYGFVVAPKPAE